MEVRVAGHQVETGESLREHAIARIEEITEKHFSRAIGANVTFGRGPQNDYTCDIVAPVAQGIVLKASHRAAEAPMAFNGAADRIASRTRSTFRTARPPSVRSGIGSVSGTSDASSWWPYRISSSWWRNHPSCS